MRAHIHSIRHIITTALTLSVIAVSVMPDTAHAAGNVRYELRPHCAATTEAEPVFGGPLPDSELLVGTESGNCATYEIRDPENLQTPVYNPGDLIDMDLVIHNPDRQPISRFRAWIAYDASVLNGMDVVVSQAFPLPTPGENVFSAEEGFIKVSGTANEPVTDEKIVVARIRMTVAEPRFEGAPLTYFDISDTNESRTGVFTTNGAEESNVMATNPGYLFIRFNTDGVQQTSSAAASVSSENSNQSQASSVLPIEPVEPSTVFTMLQVQGVRVTTEGSSVFLAWDALPSTELVGYNIYYGTTMGSYIQRRGVEKSAASITLRALPVGTTYYFAVRGVNGRGQETEFSQEVGVSVGNPRTSTSPLNANSLPTATPVSNGTVAGETGISSVLLLLLIFSAVTGTVLAFRRQMAVSEA